MTCKASWGDQGHQGYWTDANFYEDIARRFLCGANQTLDNK
jgi:hypothetical protein